MEAMPHFVAAVITLLLCRRRGVIPAVLFYLSTLSASGPQSSGNETLLHDWAVDLKLRRDGSFVCR